MFYFVNIAYLKCFSIFVRSFTRRFWKESSGLCKLFTKFDNQVVHFVCLFLQC